MPSNLPPLTLILGGASSGKSAFAERLVLASDLAPVYLATAQGLDGEMDRKITRHQQRRGGEWQLVEAPLALVPVFETFRKDQVVLLDCLTLWLSNLLGEGRDIEAEITELLMAIKACPAPVVAVSNELGLGLVPDNALSRAFRDWQGQINQRFAKQAEMVRFIAAGLPLALKGAS